MKKPPYREDQALKQELAAAQKLAADWHAKWQAEHIPKPPWVLRGLVALLGLMGIAWSLLLTVKPLVVYVRGGDLSPLPALGLALLLLLLCGMSEWTARKK